MKLVVVVERTESGYSAFAPDLPGCIATRSSRAEVEAAMQEAIAFHVEGLREEGLPIPEPSSYVMSVEVAA